jgi:hypothetical protein
MGMGAAPAAAGGGAGDSVFANTGATWGNRYVPSVGSAIGSSDILVKMIIDAPEQQVRLMQQLPKHCRLILQLLSCAHLDVASPDSSAAPLVASTAQHTRFTAAGLILCLHFSKPHLLALLLAGCYIW